ncbi:MAG: DUF5118 domain-containing protein, partial [Methylibium sp.]|nr:DUF5118 domain-containing protein [Methylibium sp.]
MRVLGLAAVLGATALWLSGCAVLLPAPVEPPAPAEAALPPLSVSGAAADAVPAGTNGGSVAARISVRAGAPAALVAKLPSAPGQPPAFAAVVNGATSSEGLITVWRKDEKIWFELAPDDLGRLLFLSPKYASGIGERGF